MICFQGLQASLERQPVTATAIWPPRGVFVYSDRLKKNRQFPRPLGRKATCVGEPLFSFGDFDIDLRDGLLFRGGRRICIQPQPLKALLFLIQNRGQLVTRQQLAQHLWPGDFVDDGQSLNVVVRNLRKVLGDDPKAPAYIETVPTKGYRFIATGRRALWLSAPHRAAVAAGLACLMLLVAAVVPKAPMQTPSLPGVTSEALPAQAKLAYLKGRKHVLDNNLAEARTELARAITLAPDFADGYLWLAKAHTGAWGSSLDNATRAEPLLLRALDINPGLAEAHAELGNIALIKDLDAAKAHRLAKAALALDPRNVSARLVQVDAHLALGEPGQALAVLEEINRIDPLRLAARATEGWVAFMAGDYDAAGRACAVALESGTAMEGSARTCLLEVHLAQGRDDLAVDQAAALLARAGAPAAVVSAFHQAQGREALRIYNEWRLTTLDTDPRQANPYREAIYLLKLGKPDRAVEKLEQVVHERQFPQVAILRSDRRLHALSDHPAGSTLFSLFQQ